MSERKRTYLAVDLKSFYASVECVERQLDPLDTNLVVADLSRTEKTICLAVSPSLKSFGIPGRPRLFEVVEAVSKINAQRFKDYGEPFQGSSTSLEVLKTHPQLKLDYIVAMPQMARYIEYSSRIVDIYLKYVAPDDLDVYSVDEVFMDITGYLERLKMTPREFAVMVLQDIYATTGITATAGIGTNLFLAKIAMDVEAKHCPPDEHGARMAELDELSFRLKMWDHRPITDFWQIGPGIANRLERMHIHTLGDLARCSVGGADDFYNSELLYREFGVNAELLIDHAWGIEPVTLADIKKLKPERKSLGIGQVLSCPYEYEKARIIIWEMAEQLSLDLMAKGYVALKATLTVGYDVENLKNPERLKQYLGEVVMDRNGRAIPKHAHGTVSFGRYTASSRIMTDSLTGLYDRIGNRELTVRRISIAAFELRRAAEFEQEQSEPLLRTVVGSDGTPEGEERFLRREQRVQKAILTIKSRHGKNAVFRGIDLEEGATTITRNSQIGGHRA